MNEEMKFFRYWISIFLLFITTWVFFLLTQSYVQKRPANSLNSSNKDISNLWFMNGGISVQRRPVEPVPYDNVTGHRIAKLWPREAQGSDRLVNQLMFVPPRKDNESLKRLKKIAIYEDIIKKRQHTILQNQLHIVQCPVNACIITGNKSDLTEADVVVIDATEHQLKWARPAYQLWVYRNLESPWNTKEIIMGQDAFNWTATYRRDSDIVTPYAKWIYFNDAIKQLPVTNINYAAGKTLKVAWFVSKCMSINGREVYAQELSKYIRVDTFGACGSKKCLKKHGKRCFNILKRDYKFYLSFENSNCNDYITEKLFINAFQNNVLPIVMGARPEDYAAIAPYKSYIHVDQFESVEKLAEYLHQLDQNDELYNEYFRWKGTGEFINTYFVCRLCALLHDPDLPHNTYSDVNQWWNNSGVCRERFQTYT